MPSATVPYIPPQQIDGEESSLAKAGIQASVTLEHDPAGRKPTALPDQKPQRSVGAALAQRRNAKERYAIEGEIARGGMGAVLRAVDGDLRREVAVKYMLDQKDAKKKARFIEEAQINAQLEHPNIVPVYDLRIDPQGRPYLMMKLVKGRDLKHVLDELREGSRQAEKEYSLGRLLNILVNVCNGLAFAHAHGVIHRDLKPANIMLGDFGEVYIMDWGLAKVLGHDSPDVGQGGSSPALALSSNTSVSTKPTSKVVISRESEADITQEGSVLGTPVYMPPEQAAGKIADIDARSDIYSLGAILYEMLTLQPPVIKEGGQIGVLMQVVQGEIVPPEKREPQRAKSGKVPSELAAVAMKALAKERERRYQTVEALRQDIERFQDGRSVSAKDDTKWEVIWKFAKRNKGFSAGAAAALLVLLLSSWFLLQAWLETRRAHAAYVKEQTEKQEQARKSVPALIRSARLLTSEGQLDDALAQVSMALNIEDNADGRLLRAQLLIGAQRYPEAGSDLQAAQNLRPGHPDARKLAELCKDVRADNTKQLMALAEELGRQKAFTVSDRVTQQAQKLTKNRDELLAHYRKRLDTAWPSQNFGGNLHVNEQGQFRLNLDQRSELEDLTPLRGIPLSWFKLHCRKVRDIRALQGMPLQYLDLGGCELLDCAALRGMPLTELSLHGCNKITDLTPLQGMKLTSLNIANCDVTDLSPLRGMPLRKLNIGDCGRIKDLAPLQGMPLEDLDMGGCNAVEDLSPLRRAPLTRLVMNHCGSIKDISPLQGLKLTQLNMHETRVRSIAPLKGMPLTDLTIGGNGNIDDISALEGMPLKSLNLGGSHGIRDFAVLKKLPLAHLDLSHLGVTDLKMLQGLRLEGLSLYGCGNLTDLTALRGMPLTSLSLHSCGAIQDLTPLQGMKLTHLDISACGRIKDLSPLRGMKMTHLKMHEGTPITDLRPLDGMELEEIYFTPKTITQGMEVLRRMRSLGSFDLGNRRMNAEEFWKRYDAGEFK